MRTTPGRSENLYRSDGRLRPRPACLGHIIRGVRNTTDFEYERTMEATNHRLHPDIITVMLFTPAPVADIASSTVREVLAFGRTVDEFMPEGIDIKIPLITILL